MKSYVALGLALDKMIRAKQAAPRALKTAVAAVSVGMVGGEALLDLAFVEDSRAEVDFNVVMTGGVSSWRCRAREKARPFRASKWRAS